MDKANELAENLELFPRALEKIMARPAMEGKVDHGIDIAMSTFDSWAKEGIEKGVAIVAVAALINILMKDYRRTVSADDATVQ